MNTSLSTALSGQDWNHIWGSNYHGHYVLRNSDTYKLSSKKQDMFIENIPYSSVATSTHTCLKSARSVRRVSASELKTWAGKRAMPRPCPSTITPSTHIQFPLGSETSSMFKKCNFKLIKSLLYLMFVFKWGKGVIFCRFLSLFPMK